ncbi:MAG: hypothetical protein H5U17_02665 [Defluviimonas sp.]|nr:hypothetical protein [Defluviimonas sp.]
MTDEWREALRDRFRDVVDGLRASRDRRRGLPWLRAEFLRRTGRELNLQDPATIDEKVQWRKLNVRDPLYPILSDKLRMRDFVRERLGIGANDDLFSRLLGDTARPTAPWLARLGDGIAIKANHASGWNAFVQKGEDPDWEQIARKARHWMRRRYGLRKQEWAYWSIPRRVLVEELLCGADGAFPLDFKFETFDGKVRCIQIERTNGGRMLGRFLPDWTCLPIPANPRISLAEMPCPAELPRMIGIAERIAAGMDYLRVDFLRAADRLVLNELTLYRVSGFSKPSPPQMSDWLGACWRNPAWPDRSGEADRWLGGILALGTEETA